MGRPHQWMDVPGGGWGTTGRFRLAPTDHCTGFVQLDWFSRGDGGRIMTGKVAVVGNATMVDEALSAGEIVSSTIQTDQLDKDAIRLSPDNHGTSPFLGCSIAAGQGLQL